MNAPLKETLAYKRRKPGESIAREGELGGAKDRTVNGA